MPDGSLGMTDPKEWEPEEGSAKDQSHAPAVEEPSLQRLSATEAEGTLESTLPRRLRVLALGRILFLSGAVLVLLLVLLSTQELNNPVAAPLMVISLAGLAAALIHALLARLGIPATARGYIQFSGDLILVTALVYQTGGLTSPFSMLYLLVIGAAATVLRHRAGITIAEISWLLYATVVVSTYKGWIPSPTVTIGDPYSVGRLAYSLAVHLVGFYGVAILTSLLSNRAARIERELARASGSLADLEVFHRDVIESMSSGLILLNLEDRIVAINRIGREILGLASDFEGRPVLELGILDSEQWCQLRDGSSGERVRDESTVTTFDGQTRVIGFSVGEIRDSLGEVRGHSLVFQELTEWRRLQEELSIKERMAAVGELAAGLAHELGNPLASISGSVQMLRRVSKDESQSKLLDIVLKESRRLDRTIKNFLRFARPHERQAHRFDVCALLRESADLLRNSEEVLDSHRIEVELESESVELIADRDQIAQVFWNLARNALRAMPKGGCLAVTGGTGEDGSFSLRFQDSGIGMSDDQVHGLFHPFRSYAGGTGIGMAIVYRIVEQHGGEIRVESEQGSGTLVEVRLPLPSARGGGYRRDGTARQPVGPDA